MTVKERDGEKKPNSFTTIRDDYGTISLFRKESVKGAKLRIYINLLIEITIYS